jgi:hypothetical protein
VLERLRLADPHEGIAKNGLDEIQRPQSDFPICFDPIPEIFQELRVEYRGTFTPAS